MSYARTMSAVPSNPWLPDPAAAPRRPGDRARGGCCARVPGAAHADPVDDRPAAVNGGGQRARCAAGRLAAVARRRAMADRHRARPVLHATGRRAGAVARGGDRDRHRVGLAARTGFGEFLRRANPRGRAAQRIDPPRRSSRARSVARPRCRCWPSGAVRASTWWWRIRRACAGRVLIPFGFQWAGVHGLDATLPPCRKYARWTGASARVHVGRQPGDGRVGSTQPVDARCVGRGVCADRRRG